METPCLLVHLVCLLVQLRISYGDHFICRPFLRLNDFTTDTAVPNLILRSLISRNERFLKWSMSFNQDGSHSYILYKEKGRHNHNQESIKLSNTFRLRHQLERMTYLKQRHYNQTSTSRQPKGQFLSQILAKWLSKIKLSPGHTYKDI